MLKDEQYIQLTIEIAKKGAGYVSPNPLVGCVIVKNNKIIGAGYHEQYGKNHAEVNAIQSSKEDVEGATLYVNLEPCCHFGKTPPCVDAIIQSKIKRVVIGTLDMNPLVSGKGIKKLKEAGIEVKAGFLEKECIELNKFFFKYITKKLPYVTLKAAQTLDGKIADEKGYSRWISSLDSRKYVHQLRSEYSAVLVGAGTIIKDKPKLNVRLVEGRNPKRIIVDSNLRLSPDSTIFMENSDKNLIIATLRKNQDKKKIEPFLKRNVEFIFTKECEGRVSLRSLLIEAAKINITSILVEGGSEIYTSFVKEKLFDDIYLFITPKLLGSGLPLVGELGIKSIKNSLKLSIDTIKKYDDDILLSLSKIK
ncbi:MAG: bifunctional diaminohydroxyphosphoribosylaminopyrimidine deaminase/5-amino-6-(5-phosphoribosylamino)uracil reductase RibD [Syntrophothermus sp.]